MQETRRTLSAHAQAMTERKRAARRVMARRWEALGRAAEQEAAGRMLGIDLAWRRWQDESLAEEAGRP